MALHLLGVLAVLLIVSEGLLEFSWGDLGGSWGSFGFSHQGAFCAAVVARSQLFAKLVDRRSWNCLLMSTASGV